MIGSLRLHFPTAVGLSLALHTALAVAWVHERAARSEADADALAAAPPPIAGGTFDIAPEDDSTDEPNAAGNAANVTATATTATNADDDSPRDVRSIEIDGDGPPPAHPPAPHAAGQTAPNAERAAATGSAAAPAAASFGAVGERGAVEIIPFFQRAFVQMASADPAWSAAAFGSAGSTTLTLTIDASGHLSSSAIGSGASAALASSVTRTLPLLAHRAFTATAPRSVLHLSAHVTKDAVHDGLHGDVFALGVTNSGTGASGTAWFALPSGRRVDLTIRAK